ncbi:hypothetical protein FRB91_011018 [Serendipita sp. 411]|nr:hypothetical protein FRB91_011018 [Serendipita sp. 411]
MTVEITTTQDDHFLTDIPHLTLEVNFNDGPAEKVKLLSRESSPGVWDANEPLILPGIAAYFTFSVSLLLGGEVLELVAWKELYGPELYAGVGKPVELRLDGRADYPNMILKMRIMDTLGPFGQALDVDNEPKEDSHFKNVATDTGDQASDFEQRRELQLLRQLISQALSGHNSTFASYGNENPEIPTDTSSIAQRQQQEAARFTPDFQLEEAAAQLNHLGVSLLIRFERLGNLDDVNNSVARHQEAVSLTSDDHPGKPSRLSDLGNSLLARFECLGNLDDIENAIARHQEAVDLAPEDHPHKPRWLSNLGNSLATRFKRRGNLNDIHNAVTRHQAAVNLTPDGHPNKHSRLNNLGSSLRTRFERLGDLDDINNAVIQYHAAVRHTPNGHINKPNLLNCLGNTLITRFQRLGNMDDINNAVSQHQVAVSLTPDSHPQKPHRLNDLGNSLLIRFERLGHLVDLNNAISRHQATISLTPDGHPDKSSHLCNLGSSLVARFKRLGNLDDINSAIARYQAAADLIPDGHPDKSNQLNNLGNAFITRFTSLGNADDINSAISQHRAAVDLAPDGHPDKSSRLSNLGSSLSTRFERFGSLDDIEQAIARKQLAVNLTPDGHPDKPTRLNNLGISLLNRFERLGDIEYLDNAILKHQEAIKSTPDGHPDKPSRLTSLGIALSTRAKHLGGLDDINNAIEMHQIALNLTSDDHPDKPNRLSNLGNALLTRFERLGDIDDLNNAISRHQATSTLTPDGHPRKPAHLNNLGNSLSTRFERLGDLHDIDDAIARYQAAVDLTPDGHADKPIWLISLGMSLILRFKRLGSLDDIDNAILRHRVALNLTPDGHPERPTHLSNLGNSLLTRFRRLGYIDDIDDAIARHQEAVDLTPDGHPYKHRWSNNLGLSLCSRYECLRNLDDINNAIQRHQMAIDLIPDDHPDKLSLLTNLGLSLSTRFEHLKNLDDINNAISVEQIAVNLTPDDHPRKPTAYNNLGSSFLYRFFHLHLFHDAETSVAYLSVAALSPLGSPSLRLGAARNWITIANAINHASLLAACECAISTIPLVAWLGLSITDRHQHLIQIGSIVRDTAAIAISLDQCDKALEWLEQGRSIVWTQILQLRTPVDQLRDVEPDLADRLLHISQLLDQGLQDINPQKEHRRSPEDEARQYRALASERDTIVERIRSLPKFHDFLRPPKLHRLLEAAKDGPVVTINVSTGRCDALALVYGADEPIHIPLSNLTSERVEQLQFELKGILKSSGVRLRAVRDEEVDVGGDEGCKRILAELWDLLVKPVLDSLAFSCDSDTLPRIWWCVTGPLASLPIHAAGVYDTEGSSRQIQDYAVSSYAPTISALLEPADAPAPKPFRHLSAIEPSSGLFYIPNTEKELECIQRRLHNRDYVVLRKAGATRQRVMNAMMDCNWLHLACHGTQDAKNPTKSALLLHDGKLTLEEVIRLKLPHAEFAFLSACQTMTGDEELSDEAVHIAGGMSLAGYRSVVATMWSIEDALGPKVADEFYAHLLQDGERPDNRRAAEALHFSVKRLREEKKDIRMLSWLPFVHLGI